MSNATDEMNDDEIRVITPQHSISKPGCSFGDHNDDDDDSDYRPQKSDRKGCYLLLALIVIATTAFAVYSFFFATRGGEDLQVTSAVADVDTIVSAAPNDCDRAAGYVAARDTVAGDAALRILTPVGGTPSLAIGRDALADSAAVLVVQAADVRADNRQIAGAYVMRGDLLSRGSAKAGFCAIIGDEISIGVADATPMLEQAIESEGYFFRQYPLVVGGQVVENKPKGRSLRKALAELDGRICVILSLDRLTFHDFSQALVDAGVRNAIYLVGSTAEGRYVDESGTRHSFGKSDDTDRENVNYLVWK